MSTCVQLKKNGPQNFVSFLAFTDEHTHTKDKRKQVEENKTIAFHLCDCDHMPVGSKRSRTDRVFYCLISLVFALRLISFGETV